MKKNLETEQGSLEYEIIEKTAVITNYSGRDTEIDLPEAIEGFPVVWIGKKAFLSNKTLRKIVLPKCLAGIGDWAFAYCGNLAGVTLPYHQIETGQGVFKECGRLERIEAREEAEGRECSRREQIENSEEAERGEGAGEEKGRMQDIAWLLAAAVNQLDAFYLFDLENAGTRSWLAGWDARAKTLMNLKDSDGFSKMLLCGEEDYGSKENDLGYYMEQKRRGKVRLAMLRLMHDYGLGEELRAELETYLLAHIKGCETEETWRVVLEEHGDDKVYYEFLTKLGGVTEENFPGMMEDMGERHTEMKAYLMRYHDGMRRESDAFSQFDL